MLSETCIVGQEDLLEMLKNEEIFQPGTWVKENVRGVAYDLRVAEDFLVVPDSEYPNGRRYRKGHKRETPIVLKPGEVAFVSSQEKIHMPWTLSANIGIKFGLARRGILTLTGLLVDPGFGMKKENGSWVPKEDERIHFLLANLGSETVKLRPRKDKIASLQFFRVPEPTKKSEVESGKNMQEEFFSDESSQQGGLVFVKHIRNAMEEIDSFQTKLNNTITRVEVMEKGTNQVVMFGVYLLSASILVGAIAFILSILDSEKCLSSVEKLFQRLPNNWPQTISLVAIIVAGVLIIKYGIQLISFLWRKLLNGVG